MSAHELHNETADDFKQCPGIFINFNFNPKPELFDLTCEWACSKNHNDLEVECWQKNRFDRQKTILCDSDGTADLADDEGKKLLSATNIFVWLERMIGQ